MKLALQLSCYNGARYLPFLFASLKQQTRRGWHLYILDNASHPQDALAIAQEVAISGLPISLSRVEKNIGFAGAHNFLYAQHREVYDAVQLLNDDAILEPDFLETCMRYLEQHPMCGAVTGKVLRWNFDERNTPSFGKTTIIDTLGMRMDWKGFVKDWGMGKDGRTLTIPHKPYRVLGVSGCLPMYRLSAVRQVSFDGGLFDTMYVIYKEDVDMALRLRAAGFWSVVVPTAVAYHRRTFGVKTFSLGSLLRPCNENSFYSYRNHLWMLKAHLTWFDACTHRMGVIPAEILKVLYWLVRQPSFVMRTVCDTWHARHHLGGKRRFIQQLRRQSPRNMDMLKPKAHLAVVMVGHNDLNEDCLASLAEARQQTALNVEIIVVDNNSQNLHANELVARFFPDAWCLLREGDYGFGRSCNLGANVVDAEYYFFLNPDTKLVDPHIFDKLYGYMQSHDEVGIIAPKILYFDGRLQETCRRYPRWFVPFAQRTFLQHTTFGQEYAASFGMRDYDHATPRDVDWVQGSALFIRGSLWKELGGFDHRYFMYFEDVDLCRRVHLRGKQVLYFPETVIQHAHGKESARIPGLFKNLLYNEMARAHLMSWGKYFLKWAFMPSTTSLMSSPPTSLGPDLACSSAMFGEDPTSWPKVAVIYLTYNTKDSSEEIPRCLASLERVNYPCDRWEIICVENPSNHGASWPFIEKDWMPKCGTTLPPMTVRKNEHDLGYAGANNVGVGIAQEHGAAYVFLLNQDTEVDPDFLKHAVMRAERDPAVGFVQSLVLLGQNKERVNSMGNRYHFLGYGYAGGYQWSRERALKAFEAQKMNDPDLNVPTFSGSAVLARVDMVKKIGLFDAPFYMYHEDIDAAFNGRVHGWKSVIEPTSIVYHYYAFSKSIKKFYWMERNRFLFLLSYYKIGTWLLILPTFLCVEIASLLFAIRGGWWREKLRAWAFFYRPSTWHWVWERRRRIQRERIISDRELLSIAESQILFQEGGADDAGIQKDVNSPLVTKIANPGLTFLWRIIYSLVRW